MFCMKDLVIVIKIAKYGVSAIISYGLFLVFLFFTNFSEMKKGFSNDSVHIFPHTFTEF
jgi:hypothetical protein